MSAADWKKTKQPLIVTLEFSENSGCRGQPQRKGWEVKEKAHSVSCGYPLPGWCDDVSWRACGDKGIKALTPSKGLLHVVNVSTEGFLCPFGLATWVKGKSEACIISLPLSLGEAMCVVLRAEPFVKSRDGGMSSPSWMEMRACREGDALG